jgi:hypothetical protein
MLAGCLGASCGTDDSKSNRSTEEIDGHDQLVDAKVMGRCPGQPVKGKAATFLVQVENTGDEVWPAVFVEWNGVRDVFMSEDKVFDGSGNLGRYSGGRGFTTYRFKGLRPGSKQSYKLIVTPVHKRNSSDVTFAAWGDEPEAEPIPRSPEIEMHECNGPWGDGR